jgi:hypothetical protein
METRTANNWLQEWQEHIACVETTIKEDSWLTNMDTEEEIDINLQSVSAMNICDESCVLINSPKTNKSRMLKLLENDDTNFLTLL